MLVNISDIKIRKRIRKDNGDIESLMESLQTHGLMNPIVISEKFELIAGFRRFTAAKKLGWDTIEVSMVQAPKKVNRLELELEENLQRLDFTEDEIYQGIAELDKYKNPRGLRRFINVIFDFFRHFFDLQEARKIEKRRKNGFISLLSLVSIVLMILTGVLHKNGYISSTLLTLFNIFSFVLFVIGIFFLVRFYIGRTKK